MGNRHPKVKSEKYRTASSPKNSSPDDEEDDIRPRDANKSSRKNKGRSPDDEEASGGSENRDEARDLSPTSPASNVTSGEKTDTPTSGGGTTQARTTEGADSSTSEARRDSKEMKRVSASRGIISRGLEFVGSKEPKSSDFIFDNSGRMVSDYYDVDKRVLGHGTYGTVTKGTERETGAVRAIKAILKSSVQGKHLYRFKQEIDIMGAVDHPGIIKLYETFEDAKNIYLVEELCTGGEMFDRIIAIGRFSEVQSAILMKQILRVVFYLHCNRVMHRDLKAENFLFKERGVPIEDSEIKVIDFGLSTYFEKGVPRTTKAGTPYYVSPQILGGKYDEGCDVWACGIIMFVMMCGYPPFYGETDKEVLARVKIGTFVFVHEDWKHVSLDATDLIVKMLKKNAEKRVTAAQALEHVWIARKAPNAIDWAFDDRFVMNLRSFRDRGGNKLKKAVLHILATHFADEEIQNLKSLFIQMDVNGTGQLSIEEIAAGIETAGQIQGIDDMEDLVRMCDLDGSGYIDYADFLEAALEKKRFIQKDVSVAAFKVLDKEGKGKVTRTEICDSLAATDEHSLYSKKLQDEIMDDVELDGDEDIDEPEFVKMMQEDRDY